MYGVLVLPEKPFQLFRGTQGALSPSLLISLSCSFSASVLSSSRPIGPTSFSPLLMAAILTVPIGRGFKVAWDESIKTTERHYAKWVKGRQDRLDALVSATWAK